MYAVFAQRKLVVTSRLNTAQMRLMQLDDQQFALATSEQNLNMALSSQRQQNADKLASLYGTLAETNDDNAKDQIKAKISEQEQKNKSDEEEINIQTYALAQKENAIELQKKRLETQITKWEKELENVEKAESSGIDRANPKYDGLG